MLKRTYFAAETQTPVIIALGNEGLLPRQHQALAMLINESSDV